METIDRPVKVPTTKEVIEAMLKEQVSSNLVDSGGIYGYAWQRNVGKALQDQPEAWGTFSTSGTYEKPGKLHMSGVLSLYHWMVKNLEYLPEEQAKFEKFCEEHGTHGLAAADEYGEHLVATGEAEDYFIEYTYNSPDYVHLSQNVQATVITLNLHDELVVLSVHGGCDARWGFSEPKVFKAKHGWIEAIGEAHVGGVGCDGSSWWWESWCEMQTCSLNTVTEDIDAIPAFDLASVNPPELDALHMLLGGAADAKKLLETSLLGEEAKQRACKAIDASCELIEQELKDTAVQTLAREHESFFVCHGGKAWLFYAPESAEPLGFADGQQMQFFA